MFKRLKRLWALSKDETLNAEGMMLSTEQGTGKAEVLPDMTEQEYQDYLKEQQGWGSFFKRLRK